MSENSQSIIKDDLSNKRTEIIGKSEQNVNDADMIRRAESLINYPTEVYALVSELAVAVAEHANNYDYVIVNGGSRAVSRVLLQSAGVEPRKFIAFDKEINTIVYKREYDEVEKLTDEERMLKIKSYLEARGVDLSQRPSMCIIDDRVKSGGKAEGYMNMFSKILGPDKFSFTTFSAMRFSSHAPRSQSFEPDPTPAGRIRSQFGKLAKNFFFPREIFDKNPKVLEKYLGDLADLQSDLSPEHSHRVGSYYSGDVAAVAKKALTFVLSRLDRTIKGIRNLAVTEPLIVG